MMLLARSQEGFALIMVNAIRMVCVCYTSASKNRFTVR